MISPLTKHLAGHEGGNEPSSEAQKLDAANAAVWNAEKALMQAKLNLEMAQERQVAAQHAYDEKEGE